MPAININAGPLTAVLVLLSIPNSKNSPTPQIRTSFVQTASQEQHIDIVPPRLLPYGFISLAIGSMKVVCEIMSLVFPVPSWPLSKAPSVTTRE